MQDSVSEERQRANGEGMDIQLTDPNWTPQKKNKKEKQKKLSC